MASKSSKFVCRKSCVDRLRFQNIYRMNRRPYLSLLDLKEKCTRFVGVSTKETDLFDRHNHRTGQNEAHVFAVLGVVCGADTNIQVTRDEDSAKSALTSLVVKRARGTRTGASEIGNNKTTTIRQSNFSSRHCSFTRCWPSHP